MIEKKRAKLLNCRKGQITVFIIIGLLIMFAFAFVILLKGQIQQGQLESAQEKAFSKVFKKEALRIFVEDCLNDELENGLIIVGKQGRIWNDQPGGTKNFEEGITGITYSEEEYNRIYYGITKEKYFEYQNAYPCDNETNSPEFCRYKYPDIQLGYGTLNLKSSTIKNDLRRYLINKTTSCVDSYILNNVSNKADISSDKVDISLNLKNDGIDVKVNYPLNFKIDGEEFFHLSNFDFFYPTKFKQLLDAAVIIPLEQDYKFIDFNYSEKTLINPSFEYANIKKIKNCNTLLEQNYFMCQRSTHFEKYNDLGIEMIKEQLPNGDDVFIFRPALNTILQSAEQYEFRIARQNRPPALDYVDRMSCPNAGYDYLVFEDDNLLGNINITSFSFDPDEDDVHYKFSNLPSIWNLGNELKGNNLYVSNENLKQGKYLINVSSDDNFGLNDWQEVRILVDRPIETNVSLRLPYEDINSSVNGIYLASIEDPVFMNLKYPSTSITEFEGKVYLDYKNDQNSENFNVTFTPEEAESIQLDCLSFPSATECNLSKYQNDIDTISWNYLMENDWGHFNKMGFGNLNITFEMNYCSNFDVTRSENARIYVAQCVPHKNFEYPFSYPYHNYKFGLNKNNQTNFTNYLGQIEINPFEATHSCCLGVANNPELWRLANNSDNPCFVNPEPNCYGSISDYTTLLNEEKGYVLEKEKQYCSGLRGNVCDGDLDYELWNGQLVCGEKNNNLCSNNIYSKCSNQNAYGYVDEDNDEINDGWCYGTMGCTNFCSSEVVYTLPGATERVTKDINSEAKTNKVTSSDQESFYFGCSCSDALEDNPCDSNFDYVFDGSCVSGECVGDE